MGNQGDDGVQRQRPTVEAEGCASPQEPGAQPPPRSVLLYEDEGLLLESLSEFVSGELRRGGASLLIATRSHLGALEERLIRHGVDVLRAVASDRCVCLDAEQTLAGIMIGDRPSGELLLRAIEPGLVRARRAARRRAGEVSIFDGMADLLAACGNGRAVLELERLGQELARRHALERRSAYRRALFAGPLRHDLLREICALHAPRAPRNPPDPHPPALSPGGPVSTLVEARPSEPVGPLGHPGSAESPGLLRSPDSLESPDSTNPDTSKNLSHPSAGRSVPAGSSEPLPAGAGAEGRRSREIEALRAEGERERRRRQEAELKLEGLERLNNDLLESSPDCIKLLDLDGRIEYMSPVGQRLLEIRDLSLILGTPWVDYWKEEDRTRVNAAIVTARAGGVGSFQGELIPGALPPRSWDVRVTPLRGADGTVERLMAVSRDITELEGARRVIVQAEKLAAAGRMAAKIAHEINNPLEAVTNLIYLAKTTPGVPEEVCQRLELADRELARVAEIAQQTLGFYRESSSSRWVRLAELVDDLLLLYERKLASKRLKTSVAVDPRLKIYCKQGELKQALSNLMSNSIDASAHGGRIWLRAREARGSARPARLGVRITLADNGAGMAPEVRQRIFVPFFTTKPGVGTGIGLWVTKSMIEQQGGTMRFRSRQGANSGTVMSFFLPNAHFPAI